SGDARHHVSLLEGRIFLAQPRLRVHTAVGPRLLRHRAAGRGTLFARSPHRGGALSNQSGPRGFGSGASDKLGLLPPPQAGEGVGSNALSCCPPPPCPSPASGGGDDVAPAFVVQRTELG